MGARDKNASRVNVELWSVGTKSMGIKPEEDKQMNRYDMFYYELEGEQGWHGSSTKKQIGDKMYVYNRDAEAKVVREVPLSELPWAPHKLEAEIENYKRVIKYMFNQHYSFDTASVLVQRDAGTSENNLLVHRDGTVEKQS